MRFDDDEINPLAKINEIKPFDFGKNEFGRTTKSGSMIARIYELEGTKIQLPNSKKIVDLPDLRFQFLELQDKLSTRAKRYGKLDAGQSARSHIHVPLSTDPVRAYVQVERILKDAVPHTMAQIVDQQGIDFDVVAAQHMRGFKNIDPASVKLKTGRFRVKGDPTIRFDPRLISGEFDLRTISTIGDPKIYYSITYNRDGVPEILVNNAVMSRYVIDFDGDEVLFREITATGLDGRKIKAERITKYPIYAQLGEHVEDLSYQKGEMITTFRAVTKEDILKQFTGSKTAQEEFKRRTKRYFSDNEARVELAKTSAIDIVGIAHNKGYAHQTKKALDVLHEAAKTEEYARHILNDPVKRANFIHNASRYEAYADVIGLKPGERQYYTEDIIKASQRGRSADFGKNPILDSLSKFEGPESFNLSPKKATSKSIESMIEYFSLAKIPTENFIDGLTNFALGTSIDAESIATTSAFKFRQKITPLNWNFPRDSQSGYRALKESGEIRSKDYYLPQDMLPDTYKGKGMKLSLVERYSPKWIDGKLVEEQIGWAGGGFNEIAEVTGSKLGLFLPSVLTQDENNRHVLLSGEQFVNREVMRESFREDGTNKFGIYDPRMANKERLPGQAVGSFDKAHLLSQNGRASLTELASVARISPEEVKIMIATDPTALKKLVRLYDAEKNSRQFGGLSQLVKELQESIGIVATYNDQHGLQINEGTKKFGSSIIVADAAVAYSNDKGALSEMVATMPNSFNAYKGYVKARKTSTKYGNRFGFLGLQHSDGSLAMGAVGNYNDPKRTIDIATQLPDAAHIKGINIAYAEVDIDTLAQIHYNKNTGLGKTIGEVKDALLRMYSDDVPHGAKPGEGLILAYDEIYNQVAHQYQSGQQITPGYRGYNTETKLPRNLVSKAAGPRFKGEVISMPGKPRLNGEAVDAIVLLPNLRDSGLETLRRIGQTLDPTKEDLGIKELGILGNVEGAWEGKNTSFAVSMFERNVDDLFITQKPNDQIGGFFGEGGGVHEVSGIESTGYAMSGHQHDMLTLKESMLGRKLTPQEALEFNTEMGTDLHQLVSGYLENKVGGGQHLIDLPSQLENIGAAISALQAQQHGQVSESANRILESFAKASALSIAKRAGSLEGAIEGLRYISEIF